MTAETFLCDACNRVIHALIGGNRICRRCHSRPDACTDLRDCDCPECAGERHRVASFVASCIDAAYGGAK